MNFQIECSYEGEHSNVPDLYAHNYIKYVKNIQTTYGLVKFRSETGFPRRLENENGHGKVMEHEKLAKSHGIL